MIYNYTTQRKYNTQSKFTAPYKVLLQHEDYNSLQRNYPKESLITFKPLTPNDHYSGHTAPLTSKGCILYIYSTSIDTEYFKYGIYSAFFSLQNAVCFIILKYLVPVLFTFYIQSVLKF